jgi:hypothetical protein
LTNVTEDEDPMDELDMLRNLSGQGSEPAADVVDRHRQELWAAIGAAGGNAAGGAERGEVDVRDMAATDVDGQAGTAGAGRRRPGRALAGIAAAAVLVAGIVAVQGGDGRPDETVSAGRPDGENGTGTGAPGGQGSFACGDELPVEVVLPPGFQGPTRGPAGDAATVPADDQLVMHWAGENARIEVRWPAAADDDAATAGKSVRDENGAADVLIARTAAPTPTPSGRVAQEMTALLGDPPSEGCRSFELTVSAADDAAVQALLDQFLFAKDLPPLISGSWTADRPPTVGRCQAPADMATPPNRSVQIDPAVWHPDPATALQTFVDSQGRPGHPTGDARLSRLDYQEVTLPDGSIAYAYESTDGFFSTVIEVEQGPEGWAVTGFEASGC